jgi:hypothetical protein
LIRPPFRGLFPGDGGIRMNPIEMALGEIEAQIQRLEAAADAGSGRPDVARLSTAIDALLEQVEGALAKARAADAALDR